MEILFVKLPAEGEPIPTCRECGINRVPSALGDRQGADEIDGVFYLRCTCGAAPMGDGFKERQRKIYEQKKREAADREAAREAVEREAAREAEAWRVYLAARYWLPNANIQTLREHAAAELQWRPSDMRDASDKMLVLQLMEKDRRSEISPQTIPPTKALPPSSAPPEPTHPAPASFASPEPSITPPIPEQPIPPDWRTGDMGLDLMLYSEKLAEVFAPLRAQGKRLDEAINAMLLKPDWHAKLTADDLLPCVEPYITDPGRIRGVREAQSKLLPKIGAPAMTSDGLSSKRSKYKAKQG